MDGKWVEGGQRVRSGNTALSRGAGWWWREVEGVEGGPEGPEVPRGKTGGGWRVDADAEPTDGWTDPTQAQMR